MINDGSCTLSINIFYYTLTNNRPIKNLLNYARFLVPLG